MAKYKLKSEFTGNCVVIKAGTELKGSEEISAVPPESADGGYPNSSSNTVLYKTPNYKASGITNEAQYIKVEINSTCTEYIPLNQVEIIDYNYMLIFGGLAVTAIITYLIMK